MNHATVARRLDSLQESMGIRLFSRRPTGCTLTDAGTAILEYAERMEGELLAAKAALSDADFHLSGTIRVGAPDGFGTAFLAPRLWRILEGHPDLVVQLVPMSRSFSLSRREADLAVTVERPARGRLVFRKLTDYSLGLYASAGYVARHGLPAGPGDLSAHRLVGHVEDLLYAKTLNYAADIATRWTAAYGVSSSIAQAEAVAAGTGIGILHGFIAGGRPELVRVLPDLKIDRSFWLVTHEDLASQALTRHVGSAIADLVRGEAGLFAL